MHWKGRSPPPPSQAGSDGPEQGASTTRNRFGGCLPWGRCDPDGAAVPLPYQVLHTRSCGECDVLWQTSPVSIPADLVLWSSGSALTSCIMSGTVHRRLCASAAAARCGTCSDCHCLRVSADTPLTALRGARHAPRSGPWNDMVCVCVRECGPEAPDVTDQGPQGVWVWKLHPPVSDWVSGGLRGSESSARQPVAQAADTWGRPGDVSGRCWTHSHPIPSSPPLRRPAYAQPLSP